LVVSNDNLKLVLDVGAKRVVAKAVAAVHEKVLAGSSANAATVYDYEQRIGEVTHASAFAAKEVDGQVCVCLTVDGKDHTLL